VVAKIPKMPSKAGPCPGFAEETTNKASKEVDCFLAVFLWERLSSRDLRAVDFSRLESRSHKQINALRPG